MEKITAISDLCGSGPFCLFDVESELSLQVLVGVCVWSLPDGHGPNRKFKYFSARSVFSGWAQRTETDQTVVEQKLKLLCQHKLSTKTDLFQFNACLKSYDNAENQIVYDYLITPFAIVF